MKPAVSILDERLARHLPFVIVHERIRPKMVKTPKTDDDDDDDDDETL
jgi:hypothetical protein